VFNGSAVVDTLNFAGNFTTADFSLRGPAGDRSIVFAAAPDAAPGAALGAALRDWTPPDEGGVSGQPFGGGVGGGYVSHVTTVDGVLSGLTWLQHG
jgi:hypothetical protein